MAYYENVFIARQDITPTQVDALSDAFTKIIVDGGGNVTKKEDWGLRTLAYKIKKNRKGYYVLMNIDAPSDAVHELERQMRLNEDVLRYLTLRVDELEEGPTLMAQNKAQGDERPRRSQTSGEAPPPEKDLKTGKIEKSVEPEKAGDADKAADSDGDEK